MSKHRVRAGVPEEHKALCALGRTSKFTSSFSAMMFSGPAAYEKGWIRVAVSTRPDWEIVPVGFTCVRHKVRSPETMLYFIVVDPGARSQGVGELLMKDLEEQTPHKRIALNVAHDNPRALAFYVRLGFRVDEKSPDGMDRLIKELP